MLSLYGHQVTTVSYLGPLLLHSTVKSKGLNTLTMELATGTFNYVRLPGL